MGGNQEIIKFLKNQFGNDPQRTNFESKLALGPHHFPFNEKAAQDYSLFLTEDFMATQAYKTLRAEYPRYLEPESHAKKSPQVTINQPKQLAPTPPVSSTKSSLTDKIDGSGGRPTVSNRAPKGGSASLDPPYKLIPNN